MTSVKSSLKYTILSLIPAREWIKYNSTFRFCSLDAEKTRANKQLWEPAGCRQTGWDCACVFCIPLCMMLQSKLQKPSAACALTRRQMLLLRSLVAPQVTQFLRHLLKMEHNELVCMCTSLARINANFCSFLQLLLHIHSICFRALPAMGVCFSDACRIIETFPCCVTFTGWLR